MISAIVAILISLAMGFGAWYFTHKTNSSIEVSTRELLIGTGISLVVLLIACPLIENAIINYRETYYEYYNGLETGTTDNVTTCTRDGACANTYQCDPYVVWVEESYTDSEGHEHEEEEPQTRYHSCPYLQEEHTYVVNTTLGPFTIAANIAGPARPRWDASVPVPGYIQTGPPSFWLQARVRIANNKPGGVTKIAPYKNYLLASDETLLHAYSADISSYQSKGLLPPHTTNPSDPIYNFYWAQKFTSVKLAVDSATWNEYLMRLNGYFGDQLKGDIHITAVDASQISDPDDYSQALFAYWKGDAFGKYAFPKNGVGVVLGVSNGQVAWARATTGLPNGNETMLADIESGMVGVPFTPDAVIGDGPNNNPGALTKILYGPNKFVRTSMHVEYGYLSSDIFLTGWDRFWIIFVASILSGAMWAIFLYADDRMDNQLNWY